MVAERPRETTERKHADSRHHHDLMPTDSTDSTLSGGTHNHLSSEEKWENEPDDVSRLLSAKDRIDGCGVRRLMPSRSRMDRTSVSQSKRGEKRHHHLFGLPLFGCLQRSIVCTFPPMAFLVGYGIVGKQAKWRPSIRGFCSHQHRKPTSGSG